MAKQAVTKPASRKAAAKATAKKAKKAPAKKAPAKKTPAKKTPAKKTPAKKTPAKKTPAKKTPAKKTPAGRTTIAKAANQRPPTQPPPASASEQVRGIPGFELDVRIADVEPEIWRRLQLPASAELCDLHLTLQLAFDWENTHRHQFSLGIRSYGPEGTPDAEDYDGLRLLDLVGPGAKLVYEYDFGDGWEHIIKVLRAVEIPANEARFQCVDGARRGPVEDSGGPAGYLMLLDDLADPSSEQHQDAVDLAGEDFDPERFDRARTNNALAELDRRLHAMESGAHAGPGRTPESFGTDGDLVLMFEAGEGEQLRFVQLPDVIVRADATMLEKLASFFSIAARAVREHGRATPDIYLSDFLRDDEDRADIIVTQEGSGPTEA